VTQLTRTLPGQPLPLPGRPARRPARLLAGSLLALTKPRIVELLLVTTLPAMFLAAHRVPPAALIVVTLAGGALAAAAANALNCVIDRDIDAVMRRTRRRPLVAVGGRAAALRPAEAVAFAALLAAGANALLGLGANWLAAVLADAAIAFYVGVYTLWLKRRSTANIVIGGAAGCLPVLVGWAAVTRTIAAPAIVLFGVVFFWTPPHFWALAIKFRDDYAAARVPMLPVVAAPAVVARKIVVYSWLMVADSLLLSWWAGWLYGTAAAALGGWFLLRAHRLARQVSAGTAGPGGQAGTAGRPAAPACAMRLFHQSIAYLALLFAVVAVAALVPFGGR